MTSRGGYWVNQYRQNQSQRTGELLQNRNFRKISPFKLFQKPPPLHLLKNNLFCFFFTTSFQNNNTFHLRNLYWYISSMLTTTSCFPYYYPVWKVICLVSLPLLIWFPYKSKSYQTGAFLVLQPSNHSMIQLVDKLVTTSFSLLIKTCQAFSI